MILGTQSLNKEYTLFPALLFYLSLELFPRPVLNITPAKITELMGIAVRDICMTLHQITNISNVEMKE